MFVSDRPYSESGIERSDMDDGGGSTRLRGEQKDERKLGKYR